MLHLRAGKARRSRASITKVVKLWALNIECSFFQKLESKQTIIDNRVYTKNFTATKRVSSKTKTKAHTILDARKPRVPKAHGAFTHLGRNMGASAPIPKELFFLRFKWFRQRHVGNFVHRDFDRFAIQHKVVHIPCRAQSRRHFLRTHDIRLGGFCEFYR